MKKKIWYFALFLLVVLAPIPSATFATVDETGQNGSSVKYGSLSPFVDKTCSMNVLVAEDGGYVGLGVDASWTLIVSLPTGAPVQEAYLYLSFAGLDYGNRRVVFDTIDLGDPMGNLITEAGPYNTARYDVTAHVPGSGSYEVTVTHIAGFSGVYGAALVIIYEDLTMPRTRVMINDGCLWIYAETASTSFLGISTAGVTQAKLTTVVQAGQPAPKNDEYYFNTQLLATDAFDGDNGHLWDVDEFDVTARLLTDNTVTFKDINDGIIVDVVILTVTYTEICIPEFGANASIITSIATALSLFVRKRTWSSKRNK